MLTSLLIPIALSAVALFFASFLSWMVFQLHRDDWIKLESEDAFLEAVKNQNIPLGSYMFPGCKSPEEMKSEEYQQKWNDGPCGIMTVFPKVNMGKKLGLTFLYFLIISFALAYLSTQAIAPGAEFIVVFRFMATAGLLTFLAATVQHAIWFHNRIIGHVIESILYAVIVGLIFGLMWPAA
ncbi:hypothetical protein [uncultured Gimesia sp.]|uniref:hypothetical protein n=1 Tax=uncultured Gimesia sp. TaxID=1678688 RepID=UPI0030D9B71C|tara:strand:+ start:30162 stop:30704 length:543 start_codon:yes stop_codon:yes gene_type:complete